MGGGNDTGHTPPWSQAAAGCRKSYLVSAERKARYQGLRDVECRASNQSTRATSREMGARSAEKSECRQARRDAFLSARVAQRAKQQSRRGRALCLGGTVPPKPAGDDRTEANLLSSKASAVGCFSEKGHSACGPCVRPD